VKAGQARAVLDGGTDRRRVGLTLITARVPPTQVSPSWETPDEQIPALSR